MHLGGPHPYAVIIVLCLSRRIGFKKKKKRIGFIVRKENILVLNGAIETMLL